jgi:multidrug transporter EmrE-like cation transporter
MFYLLGFLFAILLVGGQSLYKVALDNAGFELSLGFLLSKRMLEFLLSWEFLVGVMLYLLATGINFYMLTRFKFSSIQGLAIPIGLVFSFLAGAWFFKDGISPVNILGLIIIIFGVFIATYNIN